MQFTKKHILASGLAVISMLSLTQCGQKETLAVDYIPVKESKNGSWGLAGPDGKLLCSEEFKNAPSVVVEGVFAVEEGKNGNVTLYNAAEKPEQIPGADGLKEAGVMQDGLIPTVRKNERIKILDKKGNVQFELGTGGVDVQSCSGRFSAGLLLVKDNEGKYGYYNSQGDLVIKPQYDEASDFINKHALVKKTNKKGDEIFMVIDTNGDEIIELKDGANDVKLFKDHITYRTGERLRIADLNGEEVLKCKEEVTAIVDIQGDHFVFRNDDSEYGVMNLKGEVIVRPKYDGIQMLSSGNFIAMDDKDEEIILINDKDEKLKTIDGEGAIYLSGFGVVVKSDKYYLIYNTDLEQQGKTEFYDINLSAEMTIHSDFFDASAVADKLIKAFDENMKGISLGAAPASIEILRKAGAKNLTYKTEYEWEISETSDYAIKGDLAFDTNIAFTDYNFYSYSEDYNFNSSATLWAMATLMKLERHESHAADVALAIGKKISSQSALTEVAKTKQGAIYSKGEKLYVAAAKDNEVLYMVTKNMPEMVSNFKQLINNATTAEAAEEEIVEEVVAEEAVPVEEVSAQ